MRALLGVVTAMLIGVMASSQAFAGDVAVIANRGVPVASLTKAQIQDIFTGNLTKWDNGKKITFIVLTGGAAHESFLSDYVGKTPAQFQAYWKKQVFTGAGTAPKSGKDEKEILDFVAKTDGAIGYVPSSAVDSSVKAVSVK
jgi:ABC-type phosphate transport system substrate-binding protein